MRSLVLSLVLLAFGLSSAPLVAQTPSPTPSPTPPPPPEEYLPESAKLAIAQGNAAFDDKNYAKARDAYGLVLKISPKYVLGLVNLGMTQFYLGDLKEAEKLLKQAVQQRIETAPAWLILGLVYLDQNRLDAALAALTQATLYEPKNARAHNYLGVVAGRLGWLDAAESELRKAIEFDPNYADANFNLATLYLDRKSPAIELARRHYRRAIELGAEKDPEVEKMLSNPGVSR